MQRRWLKSHYMIKWKYIKVFLKPILACNLDRDLDITSQQLPGFLTWYHITSCLRMLPVMVTSVSTWFTNKLQNLYEDSIIIHKKIIWTLLCFTRSECSSILTYLVLNSPPGANLSLLCRVHSIFTYSSSILSQITIIESIALRNLRIGNERKKNTLPKVHIQ